MISMPLELSIAIPTFNRIPQLLQTLKVLLGQLNPQVEILIIDNQSAKSVEAIANSELTGFDLSQVRFIRNSANVGGSSNLMRCIEYATGKYVWMLGDDDLPSSDAVRTILANVKKHPSVGVFNFYSPSASHVRRKRAALVNSVTEYIFRAGSIGDLIFMSGLVFQSVTAKQHLSTALHWNGTCATQLILATAMIGNGCAAVVSDESLIDQVGIESTRISTATLYLFSISDAMLLQYPWTRSEYNAIRRVTQGKWYSNMKLWFAARLMIALSQNDVSSWQVRHQLASSQTVAPVFSYAGLCLRLVFISCMAASFLPSAWINFMLRPVKRAWPERFG